MTTINTTTSITQDMISSFTWPIIINSGVTIILGSNISLNDNNQYFIINGSNIVFNGVNFIINFADIVNYPGLFQNNNLSNTNIIIQNIDIISNSSSLIDNAGWICQSGFLNGNVKFSKTNGIISNNSGGIFGQGCYNCSSINNYTSGNIGVYGGGIFGSYCVNCNCSDSYTCGNIGDYGGGIFGFGTNYISDGFSLSPTTILDQTGNPINQLFTANNYGTVNYSIVSNSYSLGSIGQYSGGIFGYFAYKCNVLNSYTIGNGTNKII
jgi:hypothetical protein